MCFVCLSNPFEQKTLSNIPYFVLVRSGATYTLYNDLQTWDASKTACGNDEGGTLAVFHNEEDYRAIINMLMASGDGDPGE